MTDDIPLVSMLEATGRQVPLSGSAPVRLDRADRVWLVIGGPVEVFLVRPDTPGAPPRRRHLATVQGGEILLGPDAVRPGNAGGPDAPHLLAVGHPGAVIRVLDRTALEAAWPAEPFDREFAAAVDKWILRLSEAMARYGGPAPVAAHLVGAGDPVDCHAGDVVKTRGGVAWIDPPAGGLRFRGIAAVTTAVAAVPLAGESWLQADETETLASADTFGLLQDGRLWPAVGGFHTIVLACLHADMGAAHAAEATHADQRSKADEAVLAASVARVASVLDRRLGEDLGPHDRAGDPLAQSVAAAAAYLGMPFRMPPVFVGVGDGNDRLDQIGRASGLRFRSVALDRDWWRRSGRPLIVFDGETGEACAALPAGPNGYRLHHRAGGVSAALDRRSAARLAANAYAVYGRLPDRPVGLWGLIATIMPFARHDMSQVALLFGLATVLSLAVPIVTGVLFETAIPFAELPIIAVLAAMLVAVAVGQLTFNLARAVASLRLAAFAEDYLQAHIVDRVLRVPVAFFKAYTVGDLVTRVMSATALQRALKNTVLTAVLPALFSVLQVPVMYFYAPALADIAVLIIAGFVLVVGVVNYAQLLMQRRIMDLGGRISGLVSQLLVGIAKIRVANAEVPAFGEWSSKYASQRAEILKTRKLEILLSVLYAVFATVSSLMFFYVVTIEKAAPVSAASYIAFSAAYGQFMAAMMSVARAITVAMPVSAAYDRMKPILDAVPEIDDVKEHPGRLTGRLEVSHATFAYDPGGPPALKNVSIEVEPGEFVALVGGSGAGKSTLLRLILGFETPQSGGVFYDGKDLAKIDLSVVRQQLGVVIQNASLVPGSILDNIVGASSLSLDDAWEAAAKAGLDEEIRAMPMGMHTIVSESGGNLSGGQRQRLMIARALAKRPAILLFDEATSALDNATQAAVARNLAGLSLTRLVVAHRLSTVEQADRIYVMDRGEIVEHGSYRELIAADGTFKALASRQSLLP